MPWRKREVAVFKLQQRIYRASHANDWIEATEGEDLCSFIGICGAFQLDPDYLRRGLRRRLQEIREHQIRVLLQQAA